MKDKLNIPEKHLETIERYLKNMMPIDEKTQFEKRMAQELLLMEQVEEVELFSLGIRKAVLASELDDFHEDIPSDSSTSKEKNVFKINNLDPRVRGTLTKKHFSFRGKPGIKPLDIALRLNFKLAAIAASVTLIFGTFWFLNKESEHEQLFAKYFEPDYGLATNMSENKNYALFDAMIDYREGNYNTAIKKWENQLISKPKNDTLNYFLGVSYLANNIDKEAVLKLKNVIENSKSTFNKDAYLYLGLAYLKAGNITNAKENFALSNTEKGRIILSELKD